jgi:hypothetical protein
MEGKFFIIIIIMDSFFALLRMAASELNPKGEGSQKKFQGRFL